MSFAKFILFFIGFIVFIRLTIGELIGWGKNTFGLCLSLIVLLVSLFVFIGINIKYNERFLQDGTKSPDQIIKETGLITGFFAVVCLAIILISDAIN